MRWYCEKCRSMHEDNYLCPRIRTQIKNDPRWLTEAADFAVVAGEYHLVSSNSLDSIAQTVNNLAGTSLSFEGSHQTARDIQVFRRLNEDPFSRSGVFSSPEQARAYYAAVKDATPNSPKVMTAFESKLTGYAQEVDWLREMDGGTGSIFNKSELLTGNAAGVDGITYNRFTGETISRTTVKASKNVIRPSSTGIKDVQEAISKGTATSSDIIYGPNGTKVAAEKAGLNNPVMENNSTQDILRSNERLKGKIEAGKAFTYVTPEQLGASMRNGAIIGAAVELTISGITSYIRYKNGEITKQEAYREVGESAVKGAITGAALSGISLFLPGGVIGIVGGIAIGIYVRAVTTNILDEVFGKGYYEQALHSAGYVYGTSMALADALALVSRNHDRVSSNLQECVQVNAIAERNVNAILEQLGGFK